MSERPKNCRTCLHEWRAAHEEPCCNCKDRSQWRDDRDRVPETPHPDTVRFDWLHEQLTGGRHIVVNDGETLREATDRLMKEASE